MTTIDICKKCAANHRSCCTNNSGHGEKMMVPPVSEFEAQAILSHFNETSPRRFFESRPNTRFYVKQMINLFPGQEAAVYKSFNEADTHFEIKTRGTDCTFLGPQGCTLPKRIRPHFCRIYPFWFIGDVPQIFQDSNCLALQTSRSVSEVLLSLGTNPEELKAVYARICRDWELYPSMPQVKIRNRS